MLAFIRGESTFEGPGEVYVKLLPDGDPVQLTHGGTGKEGPVAFSSDGSRIAFTEGAARGDMWTVPVLGGEPARLVARASGLSWIRALPGQPRVMFSSMPGEGIHMGIFESTESRSELRTVYMPAGPNGMAHRSFLSPDGRNVLIVEMDLGSLAAVPPGSFRRRFAPGTRVGPQPAQCTDAAWSPDGKWMYLSANTGDGYHIWRQRFPDGTPEQVTSGATEEQGLSFAPDGRSFVTSVGQSQSTLCGFTTPTATGRLLRRVSRFCLRFPGMARHFTIWCGRAPAGVSSAVSYGPSAWRPGVPHGCCRIT